jgi:hypothetical protein
MNPQEEAMAVIVQQLTGDAHGDFFYPTISGVAQSHNFYPILPMKSQEGIAHIALGMGKTVVEGEKALRFSPAHPNVLPQFSTVDDILENGQIFFYALRMNSYSDGLDFLKHGNLEKRDVNDAKDEFPVYTLASTYIPDEHKIRDSGMISGHKILSFASILKYNIFPLPSLLTDLLEIGRKGIGAPVEIEFSVNIREGEKNHDFYFLQLRPMVADTNHFNIDISKEEIKWHVAIHPLLWVMEPTTV